MFTTYSWKITKSKKRKKNCIYNYKFWHLYCKQYTKNTKIIQKKVYVGKIFFNYKFMNRKFYIILIQCYVLRFNICRQCLINKIIMKMQLYE